MNKIVKILSIVIILLAIAVVFMVLNQNKGDTNSNETGSEIVAPSNENVEVQEKVGMSPSACTAEGGASKASCLTDETNLGPIAETINMFCCVTPTNENTVDTCLGMTIGEAKDIAQEGECGEEKLGDGATCNEATGTWWIDLDSEVETCNPACVIDVNTGESEVNWRCTGLL